MKTLFLLILGFFFSIQVFAQQLQWARHLGDQGFDYCKITSDSQNNIYLCGSFQYYCHTAGIYWTSYGHNDLFLIKYDQAGNELWSMKFGGNNPHVPYQMWENLERMTEIVYDSIGNSIYLAGTFYGSMGIDGLYVHSSGKMDAFLAKLDLDGNCIWIKKAGSTAEDGSSGLCINSGGNIVWAGALGNTGKVDTAAYGAGSFLTNYTPDGELLWIKRIVSGLNSLQLIVVKNDNIYFRTYFTNNIIIDTTTIYATNGWDALVAKYDLTLNQLCWVKTFSGSDMVSDKVHSLLLTNRNQLYVTGSFVDSICINDTIIYNNNVNDVFYLKINENGKIGWFHQTKSLEENYEFPSQTFLNNNGDIYFSGSFKTRLIFGLDTLFANSENTYITRMDSSGNFIGSIQFGDAQNSDILVQDNGSIVVCGQQKNTTVIGDTSFVMYWGMFNDFDIYLAKFDAITGLQTISKPTEEKLFIYANPTTGLCNINIPSAFEHEQNLVLYVYDQQGRLLKQTTIEMSEETIKLNMEALAKGMYTAVLSNGNKQFSGKIIFN